MFKPHVKATIYEMKAKIPIAGASFFKCEGKIEFCSLGDKRLRGRRAPGFMDLAATEASLPAAGRGWLTLLPPLVGQNNGATLAPRPLPEQQGHSSSALAVCCLSNCLLCI